MDEADKVDLLLIRHYLQQADYAALQSAFRSSPLRQAILTALNKVNEAME